MINIHQSIDHISNTSVLYNKNMDGNDMHVVYIYIYFHMIDRENTTYGVLSSVLWLTNQVGRKIERASKRWLQQSRVTK